jgi:glutaredoxin 3
VAKELDLIEDGSSIQQTLADQITGVRTVPQIFFNGEFFGGSDALVAANQSGELETLLKKKDISFTPQKHEL